MLAITLVVASIVVSCSGGIGEADRLDLGRTPTQRTFDMFAVQTKNGKVAMRLESDLMEHYDTDTASFDAFPHGLSVYGYTEDGLLESIIVADDARHIVPKDRNKDEIWEAFGNVIMHNVIEQQTMDGHRLLGPGETGDLHGLLRQDLFPAGLPAGIRHALRRPRAQLHPLQALRRVWRRGPGQYGRYH